MEMYVGNIPPNIKVEDLTLLCQSYGKVVFVDIKNRCKPPFAFILFDSGRSAITAATKLNGSLYQGYKLQAKVLHPLEERDNKIMPEEGPWITKHASKTLNLS